MQTEKLNLIDLTKQYTDKEIGEGEFLYKRAKLLWASVKGVKAKNDEQLSQNFDQALQNAENSAQYFVRQYQSTSKLMYTAIVTGTLAIALFGFWLYLNTLPQKPQQANAENKLIDSKQKPVVATTGTAMAAMALIPDSSASENNGPIATEAKTKATNTGSKIMPEQASSKKQSRAETKPKAEPKPVSTPPNTKIASATVKPKKANKPSTPAAKPVRPALEQVAMVAANPAPVKTTVAKPVSPQASKTELNNIVSQFASAYEQGDIVKFESLLSAGVISNDQISRSDIVAEYKDLFKNSTLRQMKIDNMNWAYKGNHAIGKGSINVNILNNDNTTAEFGGRILFVIDISNQDLVISRFNHLINENEPAKNHQQQDSSNKENTVKTTPLQKPSRDELDGIVSQFVRAYESGNLNGFVNIFSENARNGNQIGRQNIIREYAQLFGNSQDRRMNLHRMDWSFQNNKAMGKAKVEVTLKNSSRAPADTYQGDINLVVEKVNNAVAIVEMDHRVF